MRATFVARWTRAALTSAWVRNRMRRPEHAWGGLAAIAPAGGNLLVRIADERSDARIP